MSKNISIICATLFVVAGCDEAELQADDVESIDFESERSEPRGEADEARDALHEETPDEIANEEDEPVAASCSGASDWCLASCWDLPGYWVAVGHWTNTAWGQCSGKVDAYCNAGHGGTYGACWGS